MLHPLSRHRPEEPGTLRLHCAGAVLAFTIINVAVEIIDILTRSLGLER